jgi:hypothetical protein
VQRIPKWKYLAPHPVFEPITSWLTLLVVFSEPDTQTRKVLSNLSSAANAVEAGITEGWSLLVSEWLKVMAHPSNWSREFHKCPRARSSGKVVKRNVQDVISLAGPVRGARPQRADAKSEEAQGNRETKRDRPQPIAADKTSESQQHESKTNAHVPPAKQSRSAVLPHVSRTILQHTSSMIHRTLLGVSRPDDLAFRTA